MEFTYQHLSPLDDHTLCKCFDKPMHTLVWSVLETREALKRKKNVAHCLLAYIMMVD